MRIERIDVVLGMNGKRNVRNTGQLGRIEAIRYLASLVARQTSAPPRNSSRFSPGLVEFYEIIKMPDN